MRIKPTISEVKKALVTLFAERFPQASVFYSSLPKRPAYILMENVKGFETSETRYSNINQMNLQ